MSAAKKKQAPAYVPQTWKEADALIAEYVNTEAELTAIEGRSAAAVARISVRYQLKADPLRKRLKEMFDGLEAYAKEHRPELTEGGKTKSVQMTNGRFGWRLDPPSIDFKSGLKVSDIIINIRELMAKLTKDKDPERRKQRVTVLNFLRTKVVVDKEAMLKAKDLAKEVEGVRVIEDREQFYLDTSKTELPEPK